MTRDFMVQRGPVRTLFRHWESAMQYAMAVSGCVVKVWKGGRWQGV